MKNLILAFLSAMILVPAAHAGLVVVSDKTVTLPVDIGPATVKRSSAGYSFAIVKVLIPALADVTVMNHRNFGENAPCLAVRDFQLHVNDIIQNNPAKEPVPVRIVLSREAQMSEGVCKVFLVEEVTATIRGVEFSHERSSEMPSRESGDCR